MLRRVALLMKNAPNDDIKDGNFDGDEIKTYKDFFHRDPDDLNENRIDNILFALDNRDDLLSEEQVAKTAQQIVRVKHVVEECFGESSFSEHALQTLSKSPNVQKILAAIQLLAPNENHQSKQGVNLEDPEAKKVIHSRHRG